MNEQISAYLLNKFLKGECTLDEEEIVIKWYNSFEEDDNYLSSVSDLQKQELKEHIYSRINENIHYLEPAEELYTDSDKKRISPLVYTLSGIAAAVVIAVGLFMLKNSHHPVIYTANAQNNANVIVVINETKNLKEQTLSDGSQVWLSPGARISYPKTFAANSRDVGMSGESFFEVTKNPKRPFIVHTENMVTKVWGTSFRVRDSKGYSFADVAVVTGKVSVTLVNNKGLQRNPKEVMIYHDEQVTYLKKGDVFKTGNDNHIKDLTIWKKINLSFDNALLGQVLPILNKDFGVNISVDDNKLTAYTLTADFNGLSLPEILEILHKTINVNYEINKNNIELKSN